MLVPLIENNEFENEGADFFIKKYIDSLMNQQKNIDAIILACTHYPLIEKRIKNYLPANVQLLSQGAIVAKGLKEYLQRHPEIEKECSKQASLSFYTTDFSETFDKSASLFYGKDIKSTQIYL